MFQAVQFFKLEKSYTKHTLGKLQEGGGASLGLGVRKLGD